jgi:two-component system LytT family response regulator
MIRVLIVDDEPLARRGVRVCLRRAADVTVVGEAECSDDALKMIDRLRPDLVFLDVQMPGVDGFGMLARLHSDEPPLIIFLTAHEAYALKAFDVRAIDYVMKPIDDDRFDEALRLARQRLRERSAERRLAHQRETADAWEPSQGERWQTRFEVRNGGKMRWIEAGDIDWIEASGDYVTLHVGSRIHMIHASLDSIEQRLDPSRFTRIHRSSIVALDRMQGFSLLPSRDAIITLKDGTELRVSRRFRHRLRLDAIRTL